MSEFVIPSKEVYRSFKHIVPAVRKWSQTQSDFKKYQIFQTNKELQSMKIINSPNRVAFASKDFYNEFNNYDPGYFVNFKHTFDDYWQLMSSTVRLEACYDFDPSLKQSISFQNKRKLCRPVIDDYDVEKYFDLMVTQRISTGSGVFVAKDKIGTTFHNTGKYIDVELETHDGSDSSKLRVATLTSLSIQVIHDLNPNDKIIKYANVDINDDKHLIYCNELEDLQLIKAELFKLPGQHVVPRVIGSEIKDVTDIAVSGYRGVDLKENASDQKIEHYPQTLEAIFGKLDEIYIASMTDKYLNEVNQIADHPLFGQDKMIDFYRNSNIFYLFVPLFSGVCGGLISDSPGTAFGLVHGSTNDGESKNKVENQGVAFTKAFVDAVGT